MYKVRITVARSTGGDPRGSLLDLTVWGDADPEGVLPEVWAAMCEFGGRVRVHSVTGVPSVVFSAPDLVCDGCGRRPTSGIVNLTAEGFAGEVFGSCGQCWPVLAGRLDHGHGYIRF